jgi:hypothetical protein
MQHDNLGQLCKYTKRPWFKLELQVKNHVLFLVSHVFESVFGLLFDKISSKYQNIRLKL